MRSQQLSLEHYNTDKIANRYLERYDPIVQHLVDQEITVLEIGIHEGGSLLLWRDYFPKGTIIGVDLKLPSGLSDEDRIQLFRGSQDDTAFLSKVANKTAPAGFDLIIDDASHIGALTKVAFWHLFDNHLKTCGAVRDRGLGHRILGRLAGRKDIPTGAAFAIHLVEIAPEVQPSFPKFFREPQLRHGRLRQGIGR